MQDLNQKIISWQTPEYEHFKKTPDWFWAVGIISASIVIASILFGNYLLAIFVLLAVFSLGMYSVREPRIIDIKIDPIGITIHNTLFPFATLEAFHIDARGHIPKVLIKSKKTFVPLITIIIDEETISTEEIHSLLAYHLPEEELSEPTLVQLMDFLGF